jgi:pentatricopeptide repeat protein
LDNIEEIEVMSVVNSNSATAMSGSIDANLLASVYDICCSAQSELLLFVAAMLAYFVLFTQRVPHNQKLQAKKLKVVNEVEKENDKPDGAYLKKSIIKPHEYAGIEKSFQDAFESGDYRSSLQCWNAMKKFEKAPRVSLPQVVETMQRFKKDTASILKELQGFFKKFPDFCDMSCINELLESLAKRLDSDLAEKIVEMLPSIGLDKDERTYEVLLNMYFTTRSFKDVKELVSEMKVKRVAFTERSCIVVLKAAIKMGSFEAAIQHFRDFKVALSTSKASSTPSLAPSHIVSQLVELACKNCRLSEFLSELHGMPMSSDVINTMLSECVRQKDMELTRDVEEFARGEGIRFNETGYSLLIQGLATDPVKVQAIFDEVVEQGVQVTADLAGSMLQFCAQTSNVELAGKLYTHMKPDQLSVLSAFIRFFADCEQYEKACDLFEHDLQRMHGAQEEGNGAQSGRSLHLDVRMERSLMNAALKCGRTHLAKVLLSSSPSDIGKHVAMIRNCATEKNLKGAFGVFESLEQNGVDLNTVIYNTVLDACVECRDLQAAESWMQRMRKKGMTDVVSFNTLIKAHLQNNSLEMARRLVDEMKTEGLQPNRVTFNELINAMVSKNSGSSRKVMWDMVEEMQGADVKPNQVTVSILLKSLNYHSGQSEISKTLSLIKNMDEPMDEVLLSSVVEACVRIGKPDLLEEQLKHLQDSSVCINGSHTYGSLIKAYGHAKDTAGIWRCWKEMRSRHIKPTSITLGCMVEAVVNNGDSDGAFDLIHQMQGDEQCSSVINSVIYCSVLKGFTREKKMDQVWAVYKEMKDRGMELSIVTFNTLLDACARCGRMDHLPQILENMKAHEVKPNVITYSTMLKGHCQNGNIQEGFAIFAQMKKDTRMKPDEIMYNSLLDGCAQNSLIDEGLRLLEEMQTEGVPPSNFTLSILVKLMNRARRLDRAFSLVEELTKKYNFRPNVHVYTNLVQACASNQQLPRGVCTLEKMIQDGVVPESRTYSILVRTSISKGLFEQAVGLLRGALGLSGALPFLQQRGAVCHNLDYSLINETLAILADRGQAQSLAVPLLSAIRQNYPKIRIDAATQRKVMSPCVSTEQGSNQQSKGRGKGIHPWNRQ